MYSFFSEDIIEEVRANNDIVDVVAEYVRLEKKGKDFFGLCPFHKEKTPSFSVAPQKQIFYCFGCGKGGNVIHFIMAIENLDFTEAVKLLADRARIQLPEGEGEAAEKIHLKKEILGINKEAARYFFRCLYSEKGENARKYLKNRSISEQVAKKFGLGFAVEEWDGLYRHLRENGFNEKAIAQSGLVLKNKSGGYYDRFRGRLIFPIFDIRGNVIGFGGRVLDSSLPKYINSPETVIYNKGKNLYALNFAKNADEKRLVVVEGYMDVISLFQSGIINTVASLGTALTESQGRLLRKYAEEIIISYDADTAGQAATIRGLDLLSEMGCNVKVLIIPDGKDPDEFVRKNGGEAFKRLMDKAVSLVEYKVRLLKGQVDTQSIEGKIKFLNKAADLLARVENSVEREMYIKKIAREHGITEDSLYSEVLRRTRPKTSIRIRPSEPNPPGAVAAAGAARSSDEKLVYDERFVLALLCIDNTVYKDVKDKISVDSFTDPENRRVASVVLEKLENRKGIDPGELLSIVDSGSVSQFSKIISEESHCDDILKAILGKIKDMEVYKAEKRLREISELLMDKGSLNEGDVERLKQELMSLTLLIKRQKSG